MLSFRTALAKQLIGSYCANDRSPPLDPDVHGNGHWPKPRGVKWRCKNCSAKGERHRSSYHCLACNKVDRRKFVHLCVSEYFSNPQTCQCKESKFCYEPHGHVITGDLRVIENAKLRELVAKGPKYREPNRVNWKATETMFLESIDLYAKNWSKREQVELKYLSEWKDQLKELVADRISNLKGHFKSPKCKVLDQPDVKDTLHKLPTNYVLVPADKAANNVIIVCKKYYIDTLVKELGINNVNINNPTYIPIDDSFETIMKSHNQFITSVGLEISEEDQNLPYL